MNITIGTPSNICSAQALAFNFGVNRISQNPEQYWITLRNPYITFRIAKSSDEGNAITEFLAHNMNDEKGKLLMLVWKMACKHDPEQLYSSVQYAITTSHSEGYTVAQRNIRDALGISDD